MNQLVDVEALRLRVRKAEEEINTTINQFRLDTGLLIKAVNMNNYDTSSLAGKRVYSHVTIEISLEL